MTRLLILAMLLAPLLAQAEGYICVEDMSTGFYYNDGTWRTADFKATRKYLVHRSDVTAKPGIKAPKWYISELGKQSAAAACYEDFDATDNIFCKGNNWFFDDVDFRMNRKSLRFMYAHLAGFWDKNPGDEASAPPLIAIGKCSPM